MAGQSDPEKVVTSEGEEAFASSPYPSYLLRRRRSNRLADQVVGRIHDEDISLAVDRDAGREAELEGAGSRRRGATVRGRAGISEHEVRVRVAFVPGYAVIHVGKTVGRAVLIGGRVACSRGCIRNPVDLIVGGIGKVHVALVVNGNALNGAIAFVPGRHRGAADVV